MSAETTSSPADRPANLHLRHAHFGAMALLLGLLFMVAGQRVVTAHSDQGSLFFIFGLIFFFYAIVEWPRGADGLVERPVPAPVAGKLWLSRRAERAIILLISGWLLAVAYANLGDNEVTGSGLLSWLGGTLAFVVVFAERPQGGWRARGATWWRHRRWHLFGLLLVLFAAGFFRFFRLAQTPLEMTSDHSEKLLDVFDVLNGHFHIFFPRNTGREGFQFYLTALLVRLTPLPLNHLALKVGTAIFGFLTIPFTYLLGRELYNRQVGLLAAFLLAISHWHVAITRVGLRFPFTAAFATPALFFLLRALKYNRRNDWLLSGCFIGIGLHTYTAFRIVPLIMVALVMTHWLYNWLAAIGRRRGRPVAAFYDSWPSLPLIANALLGAMLALILFLPLLRFMQDAPDLFWYRAGSRAQAADGANWLVFVGNVKNALLMFNYKGDGVPANTIPGSPVLGIITGPLFLLGVAYLLYRLLRWADRRSLYMLIMGFMLLLPSILSLAYPLENPSVVRAGGAPPVIMIMAAVPLYVSYRRLAELLRQPWTGRILVGCLLLVAVIYNFNWYFVEYDFSYRRSTWNSSEMALVMADFRSSTGDLDHIYHIVHPFWVDTRMLGIHAGDPTWANRVVDLSEIEAHAADPAPKLYLLHVDATDAVRALLNVYPTGTLQRYRSRLVGQGKDFDYFTVPEAR